MKLIAACVAKHMISIGLVQVAKGEVSHVSVICIWGEKTTLVLSSRHKVVMSIKLSLLVYEAFVSKSIMSLLKLLGLVYRLR